MNKILLIIILIVVFVGGFFLLRSTPEDFEMDVKNERSDEQEVVTENIKEVGITEAEEEDYSPESGWQVFDGRSYEFEYPASFSFDGCDATCFFPKDTVLKTVFVTYPAVYSEEGGMGVCGNSFDECLDSSVKTLLDRKEETIAGQRAVRQTFISWKDWEIHEVQILNPEGNGVVSISHVLSSHEYSVPTSPEYPKYFEHMVSTFKFKE